VRQPEYFAPPKSAGLKPVPAAAAYNNALRETSIRTSSIIQAVAQPVSPPDLEASPTRPHNIYIAAGGMRPSALTIPAAAPDHPTEPTPPMSFQGIKGIYYVVLGKRPDEKSS
jgi:hypothetical protein